MARHKRKRKVAALPEVTTLTANSSANGREETMTIEEYETVRLIDYVGLTQSGAAERMGVARTTVQAIYFNARQKMARLFVVGGTLKIEGGDYIIVPEGSEKAEEKN